MKALTVLSFGAGQDSTYLLYRIILDEDFRRRFVKGHFIVVMSDTGDEHVHTYQHVNYIRNLCARKGIEFYFITSDQGYHPKTWPDLISQLKKNRSIMSIMLPRSCTDNIKIKPFYNFLNVYIARQFYGINLPNHTRNKTWIKQFGEDFGKVRVILGIAAGEEKRIKKSKKELKNLQLDLFRKRKIKRILWMEKAIEKMFPMIPEGIDRAKAQAYINNTPWNLPAPSNCKRCPFLSKQEILWLYRFYPQDWFEWVDIERAKINKCADKVRNLGVKGEKLLPEILKEAIEEFGHWTDEQLQDYKMSHGHCVKSAY